MVCGTLLAAATEANWKALLEREPQNPAVKKLAKLGAFLDGKTGEESQEYGEVLCRILWDWTQMLKLPKLGEYGVQASDLERIVSKTRNRNNPISLTQVEIKNLVLSRL